MSTDGRYLWVRDLARVGDVEQRSCLYGLLGGGSGEIGCFARGRKSKKGGQAARRKAAPLGANCWSRESMCQIAWNWYEAPQSAENVPSRIQERRDIGAPASQRLAISPNEDSFGER